MLPAQGAAYFISLHLKLLTNITFKKPQNLEKLFYT